MYRISALWQKQLSSRQVDPAVHGELLSTSALWQKQLSSRQLEDPAVQLSCCVQDIGSLAETAVE